MKSEPKGSLQSFQNILLRKSGINNKDSRAKIRTKILKRKIRDKKSFVNNLKSYSGKGVDIKVVANMILTRNSCVVVLYII